MGIETQLRYLWRWCKKTRSYNGSSALICRTSKILVGFAATAYSTLFLCVAYYLVDYESLSNPVDRKCIDIFYRLFNQSRPTEKWANALRAAVLTFSDQQVITSIALLISGYSQLRDGLAVYYWQLIVDIAWFSSVTHLTTLTCLRYYFQKRRGLKILRLISMAVTAGMLSCALASTGYLGDNDLSYDYPAWCLFHRKLLRTTDQGHSEGNGQTTEGDDWTGYYNTVYVVLVLFFLCVSYGVRVILLFPFGLHEICKKGHARLRTFARGRLREYKTRAERSFFGTYWASMHTLTLAVYCISKAAVDLYSSMLWEVCSILQIPLDETHTNYLNNKITWLAIALAWGSIRIIMDRDKNFYVQNPDPGSASSQDVKSAVLEDDVWGFGQVVAVVLLLAPLLSFVETIYGKCERSSNTTYVWTIWNHTKRLSPIESVVMDKNYERSLTSASTSLISLDPVSSPESSNAEPWTDLYKCAWFGSLVWLIYLLSLAAAANVLWLFPVGDASYDLKENIGVLIQYYLAWFGFDLAVLLLFTIISSSLCHSQDTSEFRWTWMAKMRPNRRPSKRTKLIQTTLLIFSVLILTASSAAFGFLAA